mmetsp:Transcript_2982/g.8401  ORF Transcript_2982/g.8401 Transcript_2982/m.8401 type:complete len:2957 (+) Transcript_2982:345-9215(+)
MPSGSVDRGAAASLASEVPLEVEVSGALSAAEQFSAAVELLKGPLEVDLEDAVAACWEVTQKTEQAEAVIEGGRKLKVDVPVTHAEFQAQAEQTLEAALTQWQHAVEGRVASAALDVRCAEHHLVSAFFRLAPDGNLPGSCHLAIVESALTGASDAASKCPTVFRILKNLAVYAGASYLQQKLVEEGEGTHDPTEKSKKLSDVLQRHPQSLRWSSGLLQPTVPQLLPLLQQLVASYEEMCRAAERALPGGCEQGAELPAEGDSSPAAEDHCQTISLLLQQLPWEEAVPGMSVEVVEGELIPCINNLLSSIVSHSQDARGMAPCLLTTARILPAVVNWYGDDGSKLVLPVVDSMVSSPWPVPLLLPLLLPLLPFGSLEPAGRWALLQKLMRLDDADFAEYGRKAASERTTARCMLQSAAVEGRAVTMAVYQQEPLLANLNSVPSCLMSPRGAGAATRLLPHGPCNFPLLSALRQVAVAGVEKKRSPQPPEEEKMLELVASELMYHAAVGEAAAACTSSEARAGAAVDGAAAQDTWTARSFCDEALAQLSALSGCTPGAWILAVEALMANNPVLQALGPGSDRASRSTQAFASRLGKVVAVLLPLVADARWLAEGETAVAFTQGDAAAEPPSPSSCSSPSTTPQFGVRRALGAMLTLAHGAEVGSIASGGGAEIEPWVSSVWLGAGGSGGGPPGALPDAAARLAGAAPWAQCAAALSPHTRLRSLLTLLSSHSHLVSGEPTEGGMWLWRFLSGDGGLALTSLSPPAADPAQQTEAEAQFHAVCRSNAPSNSPLELQMLWGLAKLQLAAGLIEYWATAARDTAGSQDIEDKCKSLLEDTGWWTRAAQLVDAGLGGLLVPLLSRLLAGVSSLDGCSSWMAPSAGGLLAAMEGMGHGTSASKVGSVFGALLKESASGEQGTHAIGLWVQSLCCALIQGNEAAEGTISAVLSDTVAAAWTVSHGSVSRWPCWGLMTSQVLNDTQASQLMAQLLSLASKSDGETAWLSLLRGWLLSAERPLQAGASQGGPKAGQKPAASPPQEEGHGAAGSDSGPAPPEDGSNMLATQNRVDAMLQLADAAQQTPLATAAALPLWMAFLSGFFSVEESLRDIVDKEEIGVAFLTLGTHCEEMGAPLLATYCTQAATLNESLLPGGSPSGGLPDSEHWEEFQRLHPARLLNDQQVPSSPSSQSQAADTVHTPATMPETAAEYARADARRRLLQVERVEGYDPQQVLAELQALPHSVMEDGIEVSLAELQFWGQRGRKQAAKAGEPAEGDPMGSPTGKALSQPMGDGEGDVPEVLSRCQVSLWETSMAVNQDVTPLNEQLRELVRHRYFKQDKLFSRMVDVGTGGKVKVNSQVAYSQEAEGWEQLLASNRHAAEQTVTTGLLEAPYMTEAAAALATLERALAAAGLTQSNTKAAGEKDSEDDRRLRHQLCMVLCDVLLDGSTPPLGMLPIRRVFVAAASHLSSEQPGLQAELLSHTLLAADKAIGSSAGGKRDSLTAAKVMSEATELLQSWMVPSQMLDKADSGLDNTALDAFSGCLRGLMHYGSVLPAASVKELLSRFDVQRYVDLEVGGGAGGKEAQEEADSAAGAHRGAPRRITRAFKSSVDALKLPGAEDTAVHLLEALVCVAPSQHFAACLAVALSAPRGREDARAQALAMLSKLPVKVLGPNVVGESLHSVLTAIQVEALLPPFMPYDLMQRLLQAPGLIALLEGRPAPEQHPSLGQEWTLQLLPATSTLVEGSEAADTSQAMAVGSRSGSAGGSASGAAAAESAAASGGGRQESTLGGSTHLLECELFPVKPFPPGNAPQLLSDLLGACLQALTRLYDSNASAIVGEELTLLLSAWLGSVGISQASMNLAWRHYCEHWEPFLALTAVLTQGAATAAFTSFWAGLPWEMATFHNQGPSELASLRQHLCKLDRAALQAINGLSWSSLVEDLAAATGALVSAGGAEEGSSGGDALAGQRELVTQAALLAVETYVLVGSEGSPQWVSSLLADPAESGPSGGVGEEEAVPRPLEGLRMWQLLAAADWEVMEAVMCPDQPEGAVVERPAGHGFGLLQPLMNGPPLVAPLPGKRLLQVLVAMRDAALERRSKRALAVATAAAAGTILTSIGPAVPPSPLPGSPSPLHHYWHMDDATHRSVMGRVMVPLVRLHVELMVHSSSGSEAGVPALLAVEALDAAPVLLEAVEPLPFANSELPLGRLQLAGQKKESVVDKFVGKFHDFQAQASTWLSSVRRDTGKDGVVGSGGAVTPSPATPQAGESGEGQPVHHTPGGEPDMPADGATPTQQLALRAALQEAMASQCAPAVSLMFAQASFQLQLARAAVMGGTLPAANAVLADVAEAGLRSCLRVKDLQPPAPPLTPFDPSGSSGGSTSYQTVALEVADSSSAERIAPMDLAIRAVLGLPMDSVSALAEMAADNGAALSLVVMLERIRRESMLVEDSEWQTAACSALSLAARLTPAPAPQGEEASRETDSLLLWLELLSWLADARWNRVASAAQADRPATESPTDLLLAVLALLDARVETLQGTEANAAGTAVASTAAGSSSPGLSADAMQSAVAEGLRNVRTGISSLLHGSSGPPDGSAAILSENPEAAAASSPSPGPAASPSLSSFAPGSSDSGGGGGRFSFGALRSSLGEAAKASQGMGSSLKARLKGIGGAGGGSSSGGGLVFPQGTTVPVAGTPLDPQGYPGEFGSEPLASAAEEDTATGAPSPEGSGRSSTPQGTPPPGSSFALRAKGAVTGGFRRAFKGHGSDSGEQPGDVMAARHEQQGGRRAPMAGLADRLKGLRPNIGRGAGARPSPDAAREAVGMALAAHTVATYIRATLCPALLRENNAARRASAQLMTPSQPHARQNSLGALATHEKRPSMTSDEDALLSTMDQVLETRATLDTLLALKAAPLVAAELSGFRGFFDMAEALLGDNIPVEEVQSQLPQALFPSLPHLRSLDARLVVEL